MVEQPVIKLDWCLWGWFGYKLRRLMSVQTHWLCLVMVT